MSTISSATSSKLRLARVRANWASVRPSLWDAGAVFGIKKPLLTDTGPTFFIATRDPITGAALYQQIDTAILVNGQCVATATSNVPNATNPNKPPCLTSNANTPLGSTQQGFREIYLGDSAKPRIAVGIGVNWNSPFGPFRVDFAHALLKEEGDDTKRSHVQRRNTILMKALFGPVLAAGLVFAATGALVAAPASAQVVKGIGVIDPTTVVNTSAAYKTAEAQRPVTYKAYYDQAKARNDQINAQLKPLVDKFEADRAAPNPNTADLQKQAAAIQQIDQQGQRELQQILIPVVFSQEYVDEQIQAVLPKAIETVATKKNISLIFNRGSGAVVYRDQAYNINADVTAELDIQLPTAQLTPPPGWLPRELREQQAAQNGGAPAAAQRLLPPLLRLRRLRARRPKRADLTAIGAGQ